MCKGDKLLTSRPLSGRHPGGPPAGVPQALSSTAPHSSRLPTCVHRSAGQSVGLEKVSPPDQSQTHLNVTPESIECVLTEVSICEFLVFKNI